MADSYVEYNGDGTTQVFNVTFPYLSRKHVKGFVDGVEATFTFVNSSSIRFDTAPADGLPVFIRRETSSEPVVDFQDGSRLLEENLDNIALQSVYITQEAADRVGLTLNVGLGSNFDANYRRLINLDDPVGPQDAVTKEWAETAMSSDLVQAEAIKQDCIDIRDGLDAELDFTGADPLADYTNARDNA